MARILLIETATDVCSVAIAVDGAVVAIAEESGQSNHAARLTLLIEQCAVQSGIALNDLDAVALSRGPGSYTGLRVGASVAKGICYALDKPLIAVDTLQALAAAALLDIGYRISDINREASAQPNIQYPISNIQYLFLPMLDARRQEVWTAVYDANLHAVLPAQPLILEHNLFQNFLALACRENPSARFIVSGNGGLKLKNVPFVEQVEWSIVEKCSARYLAALAERLFQNADFQDVSYFEPYYMKPPNITAPAKVSEP